MRRVDVPQSSADYVYEELKNRIISKQLRPGQRLPEISLAKQLEVSRTPVREALRRLANEGLVALIPNGGARLISPSVQEIHDTFELRSYLESLAAKKAAKKITPVQICMLEEQIQAEKDIFNERNLDRYLEINNAFHQIVADASGNQILSEYIANVISITSIYMVFYESFFNFNSNPSLEEHEEIVEALRNGEEDRVAQIMEEHIMRSEKGVVNLI